MGQKINYNEQRQWRKYREEEEITDGEEEELRSKIVAMIPERRKRKSDKREIISVPLHHVALNSILKWRINGCNWLCLTVEKKTLYQELILT